MKIAIHNLFYQQEVAETELAQRLRSAAHNIGWQAAELASAADIRAYQPDFVISLHFTGAKITEYPTYGCLWNPLFFFSHDENFVRNVLSYDGYLCGSEPLSTWIRDVLYSTPKKFVTVPFYPSCNATVYRSPNLEPPRLAYIGSNWDGERFKELFLALAQTGYFETYGQASGWAYLGDAYQAALPFDGVSVLATLNQAGVGLCLHRDEHCQDHLPAMRIFEIAAAGAIAICDDHPFIKQHFGDTVLYLDPTLSVAAKVEQITQHLNWINAHQPAALAMSAAAHKIFVDQFSLEKLLANIAAHHHQLIRQKGFVRDRLPALTTATTAPLPEVQLIIRVGERSTSKIRRALDSIARQTYPNVSAIVVKYNAHIEGLDHLLSEYQTKFPIRVFSSANNGLRSTSLWQGLAAVSSKYFGILDDDDAIHPNHVHTLVTLLEQHLEYGLAYSGAIRVWEYDTPAQVLPEGLKDLADLTGLRYFQPFDLREMMSFRNFITSNSFIAKSALIKTCLKADPELEVFEDFLLLLSFCGQTSFLFSYEATCEFYHRVSMQDNSVLNLRHNWPAAMERVRRILRPQEFILRQTIADFDTLNSTFAATQAELHTKWQHWQSEMARSTTQFNQTQAQLTQSHQHLQLTQAELTQAHAQLQQTQSELAQSHQHLQQTQAELTQAQTQLQQTQTHCIETQAQLQTLQHQLTNPFSINRHKDWLKKGWANLKQAWRGEARD